jgi:hypothetical protein
MRRFVFTFAATGLLFVFGPAAALAHHQSRGHHGTRAHHAHIRRFGDVTSAPTTTSSTDNVGTVASFTGGVLTITLNDGSTVSGAVTNDTAIECMSSGQSQSTHDSGDQGSGDNGDQSSGSGDQTSGSDDQADQTSGSDEQGDQSSSTEDQGDQSSSGEDQGDASSSCSSADLTAGKTVHAAELKITSAGKTWDKVELGS